jgi:hypothetical protein
LDTGIAPDSGSPVFMIVFDLICSNHHAFEGWFASSDEFSRQLETGLVACPVCRDHGVSKRPSAVHINRHADNPQGANAGEAVTAAAQLTPTDMQQVLDYLLKNTEDVGRRFPEEARKIHQGESPRRGIRGEADRKELEALEEEGISVLPLPVPAKRGWH